MQSMPLRCAVAILLALSTFHLHAADDAAPDGVDFSIRFFDRAIYATDSEIPIQISIGNDTGAPYRFKLAENRIFNVDFEVRTSTLAPLEPSKRLLRERFSTQQLFYREIALEPGEGFAFTENLQDYVAIPEPGIYVVSGRFYPELISEGDASLQSRERLTLSVRPVEAKVDPIEAQTQTALRRLLRRESLSPDQVVTSTLRARQRGQFERFLLYIDLESLLRSTPERDRRFSRLSEAERFDDLERFRGLLLSDTLDEGINAVPEQFRILRTSYTPDLGEVVAELRFSADGFTEIKEYTYLLRRSDTTWEIYDYSVQNVGIE